MKVVVLGGYGVFGGRLVRLLLRDGHDVWIAGRSRARAEKFAQTHGGRPVVIDRNGDLAPLLSAQPDALIDAVGPFQNYGGDALRVAQFCIDNAIHYLDLSDDAAFTQRVSELDDAAIRAGVFVLSGASSAPALSASVVEALADGLDNIDTIDAAIIPGARSARGRSVIEAYLAQVGGPVRLYRGGVWRTQRAWSDRRIYQFPDGVKRAGRLIDAPDIHLFPQHFGARSVTFRAGVEFWALNAAVSFVAFARRRLGFRPSRRFAAFAEKAGAALALLGSDVGAMAVTVTGTRNARRVERRWRLIARNGDGPFIPGAAVRAVLRRSETVAPGARPCVGELSLAEMLQAMSDLPVEADTTEEDAPALFEHVLGPSWGALPSSVRRLHAVADMASHSGRARVTRGAGLIARLAAAVFRFPNAAEDAPVAIMIRRTPEGERWERNFNGRVFRSTLSPAPRAGHIRERFGLMTYEMELPVEDGAMRFPVRRGWFLGVPMPRWFLPKSESREYEADGRFCFDVGLYAPFGGGLIVRYQGWFAPDAEPPELPR